MLRTKLTTLRSRLILRAKKKMVSRKITNYILIACLAGIASGAGERHFAEKEKIAEKRQVLSYIEVRQDFNHDGAEDYLFMNSVRNYQFFISKKDEGYERARFVPDEKNPTFITESGIVYDVFGNEIKKAKLK